MNKSALRREKMNRLLEQQASSGMSKRSFCDRHGINPATFYYWQRRLAEEQPIGFQKVKLSAPSRIEVALPGGTCLNISGADITVMAELISAIDRTYA